LSSALPLPLPDGVVAVEWLPAPFVFGAVDFVFGAGAAWCFLA
jgi:hypothetical protein